ncbi:MAG TPA: hypothetical protein VIS77_03770 [Burkholderiales bacterium]
MLLRMLSRAFHRAAPPAPAVPLDRARPNVLSVGAGSEVIRLPRHYAAWKALRLDVDPELRPDVLLDARELIRLPAGLFDAVYCSHNLEHYHAHEVAVVLAGFAHVTRAQGFVEIRVPDLAAVARHMVAQDADIEDRLYDAPAGPITLRDVIYGYGRAIAESGNDFYAHKTGFTRRALAAALQRAGFAHVFMVEPLGVYELRALGLRTPPDAAQRALLQLPEREEARTPGPA